MRYSGHSCKLSKQGTQKGVGKKESVERRGQVSMLLS